MRQTTRLNYWHRITKVIDYIHNNFNGNLSVNVLADIAVMSPYHFHRIYRELAQKTVNATIRHLPQVVFRAERAVEMYSQPKVLGAP